MNKRKEGKLIEEGGGNRNVEMRTGEREKKERTVNKKKQEGGKKFKTV